MLDTLTVPPLTPAAGEEPALYVCVWDHVARTVAWLDAANGRSPHETAVRVMKIAEEAGEAVAAYIGTTGANPRKGVTATPERSGRRAVRRDPGRPDRPGHGHRWHSARRIPAGPARRRPCHAAAGPRAAA